ncbi:hypothetical protein DFH07DRAFT_942008 [Mycena maculata]|uniref:Cytochrome P450 n=1 Tax=Mycena maculata TaxID=230809 RepID=A0AAD7N891_9AGAR|nr:hypothetical protein DFH07DRAFT_942008 [Mycena maculata]
MLLAVVSTAAAILVYRFVRNLASVNFEPGMRPLFSPLGLFGAVIPTCSWNPGLKWVWEWRKTNFGNYQYDVVSMVPLIFEEPYFYTCSVDVLKQLLNNESKTRLVKPPWLTAPLLLWGDNIISANGQMWKRHRRCGRGRWPTCGNHILFRFPLHSSHSPLFYLHHMFVSK